MAELALDVTVLWGGDVLASRQLGDGEEAAVGDGPDVLAPLPLDALPARGPWNAGAAPTSHFVFASVAGRRGWCHLPGGVRGFKIRRDGIRELVFGPGDLEVAPGEEIRIPLGAFTLVAVAGERSALAAGVAKRRRFRHAPTLIGAVSVVALVHAALLTFGSTVRPPPERGTLAVETATEVRTLLAAAEKREAQGDVGDGLGGDAPSADLFAAFDEPAPEGPPAIAEAFASVATPGGASAEALMCVGEAPAVADPPALAAAPDAAKETGALDYAGPAAGIGALLGLGLLGLMNRRALGLGGRGLREGRRGRTRRPR